MNTIRNYWYSNSKERIKAEQNPSTTVVIFLSTHRPIFPMAEVYNIIGEIQFYFKYTMDIQLLSKLFTYVLFNKLKITKLLAHLTKNKLFKNILHAFMFVFNPEWQVFRVKCLFLRLICFKIIIGNMMKISI